MAKRDEHHKEYIYTLCNLFAFLLQNSKSRINTYQLIDHTSHELSIIHFNMVLGMTLQNSPKKSYSQIYQLYEKHDNCYYKKKFNELFNNIILLNNRHGQINDLNDTVNIICDLLNQMKMDIAVEIVYFYKWLRKHPAQRTHQTLSQ